MLSFVNSLWFIVFQFTYSALSAPIEDVDLTANAALVIPLQRRAPTPGGYLDLPAMANHLRAKHGFPTIDTNRPDEDSETLQRRINFNNVELFDDGPDVSYFATIGVGTPPKKFNVVLDTGSSDLFLSSTLCTEGCEEAVVYNPANSRTSQVQGKPVDLTFGSIKVNGELASDLVLLGGFRVNPQTFVMAKTIQGEILSEHVHGLLGLGFQPLAKTGAIPFVESLVNGKRFGQPVMSFYFQRHLADSDNDVALGGTLTLGDVNPQSFVGTIERHSVEVANFWAISLESITSQGNPISIPSNLATAVIDTGATLIGAPSSIFSTVCKRLGGVTRTNGLLTGFCVLSCNMDPNSLEMAFTFTAGKAWPLNSTDLIYPQPDGQNDHVCVSPIFDLTPGGGTTSAPEGQFSWIIGLPFLKNVYTVFDFSPPSVGFAALHSEIPPPPTTQKLQKGSSKKRPLPSSAAGKTGKIGSSPSLKSASGSSGSGALAGSASSSKGTSKFPCINGKILGLFSC